MEENTDIKIKRDGTKLVITETTKRVLTPVEAFGTLENMKLQEQKANNEVANRKNIDLKYSEAKTIRKKFEKEIEFIGKMLLEMVRADINLMLKEKLLTRDQKLFKDLENEEHKTVGRHEIITEVMVKHNISSDNPLSNSVRGLFDEITGDNNGK